MKRKSPSVTACAVLLGCTVTAEAAKMEVESAAGDLNSVTVTTTGAKYIVSRTGVEMWRRIDPRTNSVRPRKVAVLTFGSSIGPLSIESKDPKAATVRSPSAAFRFHADSLFFLTANSAFACTHTNLIADAPWNKGKHLDRMWTDGYGGSLHATVSGGAAAESEGQDFTTINMSRRDTMAFMVYPPRLFDFDFLYGKSARPFVHFVMPAYMGDLTAPGGMHPYVQNGFGVFVLWASIYDNPNDYPSRPILLDCGAMGYKVKEPGLIKKFIDVAHRNRFKVLSYIVFLRNPKWRYPRGHPKAGQYQDAELTLEWMRNLQKEFDLDGWYLDGAETGDFMDDYNFTRQVREDVGEEGVIYYHDSMDPWACNRGREHRFCGLKAVFLNAYADYSLSGEVGDLAAVDSPNDAYYRFYTCGYGMSQTYCAHKRKTFMDAAVSEQENDRLMGENLFGAQRTNRTPWSPSWATHFKKAYDMRRAEYLSGHFDPDIRWPIEPHTGWFRRPSNIQIEPVSCASVKISWETQEPSDSEVAYTSNGVWWPGGPGKDGPDGTVKESAMVGRHNTILSGLRPGGEYEFRIRSSNGRDVPGEIIWGHVGGFNTAAGP